MKNNTQPKILFLLVIILYLAKMNTAQNVTIEGKDFKIGDDDFYPVVCNYHVSMLYETSGTDFFFSPIIDDDDDDIWLRDYECDDNTTCIEQMRNHLQQLKSMGFNTVRLVGFVPKYSMHRQFVIPCKSAAGVGGPIVNYLMTGPDFEDHVSLNLFNFYKDFLNLAYEEDIKVIMLGASKKFPEWTFEYHEDYPKLLAALGEFIYTNCTPEEKSALLAYDLANEPWTDDNLENWPESNDYCYKKAFICSSQNNWYDVLKSSDPEHLITLGGHGHKDIYEWDLSILKLDFISPHIYPQTKSHEPESERLQCQIDRVKGVIYWIGQNSPMPWIIGETAYAANTTATGDPFTQGSLDDQQEYASQTLEAVKANGGSGYSWWVYQNLNWSNMNESYGLLQSGNCFPLPCTSLEKPMITEFKTFDPSSIAYSPTKPANYYNPYNYDMSGVNPSSEVITGTVVDEFGYPIKNAVIYAHTTIADWPFHYTFTNEDGYFELLPYDTDESAFGWPRFATIKNLKISASGAERVLWGSDLPDSDSIYINNGATYILNQNKFYYELNSEDQIISESKPDLLKAWNIVTANNLQIYSGVEGDISSRSEVHFTGETNISFGSEVHIFNTETFADCACFTGDFRSMTYTSIVNAESENKSKFSTTKSIDVVFELTDQYIIARIFPNPARSEITIEISGNPDFDNGYTATLTNTLGKRIRTIKLKNSQTKISIVGLSEGLYTITISGKAFFTQDKIIKF